MPELAEVEFHRREWNAALGHRILRVHANTRARIFRDAEAPDTTFPTLAGKIFRASFAHGKNLLFAFSGNLWLGAHLGMTGKLSAQPSDYLPDRHDHLVLFSARSALVFSDPRMFGRLVLHRSADTPPWWRDLPPAILSPAFTARLVETALARHARSPLKAILLDQAIFPGIGNWMADEILWRCGHHPRIPGATLTTPETRFLWKTTRRIARDALRIIGSHWGDPPDSWLFNHRWKPGHACPRCHSPLTRSTVAARTSCWCPTCQPEP